MKLPFLLYSTALFFVGCGGKDRNKNKDLQEQNEQLKARTQASDDAARAAEKQAQDAESRATSADAAAKQAQQIQDQETARAKVESLRAADAEAQRAQADAQRASTQSALDLERAKTHEDVALRPYNGVWVAEQAVAGISSSCNIMTIVSSMTDTITRAVVCDSDKPQQRVQIEVLTPSDFDARDDLFPHALGFSVSAKIKATTCGSQDSVFPLPKDFIFDHTTRAGAVRATYMFSTIGDGRQNIVFSSGASIADFSRQQSCDSIVKLAAQPDSASITLLQTASALCQASSTQAGIDTFIKGCFTAHGFKSTSEGSVL